eukprot:tig00021222_g19369.t1
MDSASCARLGQSSCERFHARAGDRRDVCRPTHRPSRRGGQLRRSSFHGAESQQIRRPRNARRIEEAAPLGPITTRAIASAPAERRGGAGGLLDALRRLERRTRPKDPDTEAFLRKRWESLPEGARHEAQMLGRISSGCEGTQGVFPRCNFACKPCYHTADANHVRTDGTHTLEEIRRQMEFLQRERGPVGYTQLIGGEVTLLDAEDHAQALLAMREAGRLPMSFTHGDFGWEYLRDLARDPETGRGRFDVLSFACHFDMFMYGRRGVERPTSEADLHPYRRRLVAMFERLRRELGVRSYLAHNMTVSPGNVDQIPEVVRACVEMGGWRMLSFQPAAYVGDERRWGPGEKGRPADFESLDDGDGDPVWRRIEEGLGCRLPYRAFVMGDARCNRTCWGLLVGGRYGAQPPLSTRPELKIELETHASELEIEI